MQNVFFSGEIGLQQVCSDEELTRCDRRLFQSLDQVGQGLDHGTHFADVCAYHMTSLDVCKNRPLTGVN